jgi:uncharacterized protein YcnI
VTPLVRFLAGLLAAVTLAVAAATAGAHVSVLPATVEQGIAQEFTIRVPTEGDLPTTAVSVDFPEQITVYAFAQVPGWTVRPLRAPNGRFRGVEYTGGEIPAAGYADFTVLGTPFELGTAVFPARQTYGGDRVKLWTDPPDEPGAVAEETGPNAPGPAAAVEVVAAGAAADPSAAATSDDTPVASESAAEDDDGSGAAIWLGVIAIAISALAMLGVGLLWSTRPARLPADDERS